MVATMAGVTSIVSVQMVEATHATLTDAVVRDAFKTLAIRQQVPESEKLAVLPYKIGNLAKFRIVRSGYEGVAILTDGPNDEVNAVEQPFMLIGVAPGEAPKADDRDKFARGLFSTIPGLKDIKITRSEPLRMGQAQGYEIVAEAKDAKSSTDVSAVQWVRFGQSGYLQIFAIVRKTAWNEDLVLQRYELLYEAALVSEADAPGRPVAEPLPGMTMRHDHRRILATGIIVRRCIGRGRLRLRAALGNTDQRRTQHALADGVAGLHDLHHGAGGHRSVRNLQHRLMQVRIELLPLRLDLPDAVLLHHLDQFALGQFDAVEQRFDARIRFRANFIIERLQRAFHIVRNGENIAREIGDTVGARIRDLPIGAPAQVFHVGQCAQQPVLQLDGLFGERRNGIRRGFAGRGGFGRLGLSPIRAGGRIRHRERLPLCENIDFAPDIRARRPKIKL